MKTGDCNFVQKGFLLGCLFLIMSSLGVAQNKVSEKKLSKSWSINLNGGSTVYWGYLSNNESVTSAFKHGISMGYGVVLTKQISPVFGIRGELLMGNLKGRKDFYGDGLPANLNFSSDLVEGNLSVKISFTDLFGSFKPKRFINVYGLAGIGLSNFNGRVINSVNGDTLFVMGHGSGKGIFGWEVDGMVTAGVGLSLRLNRSLDFTFENSMKFLQTDKLGRVRGLLSYDMYSYSSVGISYKIGASSESKKTKKPTVEKKPDVIKKDDAFAAVPKKAEDEQVEKKEAVVAAPAPIKVENKTDLSEKAKVQEVKKEEVKPAEMKTPAVNTNLYTGYKVQICAFKSAVTFEKIMKSFKIHEQIREDHIGVWYRYSVGEFQTGHAAMSYKKQLIMINKAKTSFVVKFENGIRVSAIYR